MPPKKKSTIESGQKGNCLNKWAAKVKQALEKKDLESICAAFEHLQRLIAQDTKTSLQHSKEVKGAVKKSARFLLANCTGVDRNVVPLLRDAWVAVGMAAVELKHADGIERTALAISLATHDERNSKAFRTAKVRDALVVMGKAVAEMKDGFSILLTANAIFNVTATSSDRKKKDLFRTAEMREALVAMGNAATELKHGGAIQWVAGALLFNTLDATQEVRDALTLMGKAAAKLKHPGAIFFVGGAIAAVTCDDKESQKLFGTEGVRDALVAMGKAAVELNWCEAMRETTKAIRSLHSNKAFDVKEVKDVLVAMGKAQAEEKRSTCRSTDSTANKKRQR